jgi:hypothetical protein
VFRSLFQAFSSLISFFKGFSKVPIKDPEALEIQVPAINTLGSTESTIEKGVVNEDRIKRGELASHFEYLSTISSFEDPVFKSILKNLLKDKQASWSAFESLSPESVW